MDTIGSLIDKLITIDMKMWYAQETFYKIREMDYEQFKEYYLMPDSSNAYELYTNFKRAIDLNLQRNQIIDEIDKALATMVEQGKGNIQLKHKTY